jgi:hypothetical protein
VIGWWSAAGGLAAMAVAAGVADRQRRRRRDLDRIGLIDWPAVQLLALGAAVIAVSLALHA